MTQARNLYHPFIKERFHRSKKKRKQTPTSFMEFTLDFTAPDSHFQRANLQERLIKYFPNCLASSAWNAKKEMTLTFEEIKEEFKKIDELQTLKNPSLKENKKALLEEYRTALYYIFFRELEMQSDQAALLSKKIEIQNTRKKKLTQMQYIGIPFLKFLAFFIAAVVFVFNGIPAIAALFALHLVIAPITTIVSAFAIAVLGIHFFMPAMKNWLEINVFPSIFESYDKQCNLIERINNLLLEENLEKINLNAAIYRESIVLVNSLNEHINGLQRNPPSNQTTTWTKIKLGLMITTHFIGSASGALKIASLFSKDLLLSGKFVSLCAAAGIVSHLPLIICLIAVPSLFITTFSLIQYVINSTIRNAQDQKSQDHAFLLRKLNAYQKPCQDKFIAIHSKKVLLEQKKNPSVREMKEQDQSQRMSYSSNSSSSGFPFLKNLSRSISNPVEYKQKPSTPTLLTRSN